MEKEETWRAEKEAPKPLKTQYPEGGQYKTLCTLTGSDADNPRSFPDVYHKIANALKKVGTTWIVQHHVTALAWQRAITPPVVQVGCATCFVTLEFHGEVNTIDTGCLPLCITPSKLLDASNKFLLRNIKHNTNSYKAYAEQVHGLTKKDLDFLTNIRGYFPKAYKELQLQIRQYDPFLQSMLGDNHLMLLKYRGVYNLIFENWIDVISCLNAHYGNDKVGPTAIVWFFHFYIQGYLRKQYETINTTVAIPLLITWVHTFLVRLKVDSPILRPRQAQRRNLSPVLPRRQSFWTLRVPFGSQSAIGTFTSTIFVH